MMWIFSVFIMTYVLGHSFGCTCIPVHIQNEFCKSTLVIRGKAVKRYDVHMGQNPETTTLPPWARMVYYKVEVIEVFKAPRETYIKVGDVLKAFTTADQGMCGGWLNLDVDLLIMGNLDVYQQIRFGLCSYKKPFDTLTKFQLEGVLGSYSCECRVLTWQTQRNDRGCTINVIPGYDSNCLHNYGQCVLGKENNCVWRVEDNTSCTYTDIPGFETYTTVPINITFINITKA